MNSFKYIGIFMHIYIYIYIYTEREREREGKPMQTGENYSKERAMKYQLLQFSNTRESQIFCNVLASFSLCHG